MVTRAQNQENFSPVSRAKRKAGIHLACDADCLVQSKKNRLVSKARISRSSYRISHSGSWVLRGGDKGGFQRKSSSRRQKNSASFHRTPTRTAIPDKSPKVCLPLGMLSNSEPMFRQKNPNFTQRHFESRLKLFYFQKNIQY